MRADPLYPTGIAVRIVVVAAFGFGAVLLGTGVTCLGFVWPRFVAALEFAGGLLVIAGLLLLGRELAMM